MLTEWEEFHELDLSRVKKLLRLPILLDGKSVFNPQQARAAGLNYYGIGSMPAPLWKPTAQESIHTR